MEFHVELLSFYLMEQPPEENAAKQVRISRVLSHDEYQASELRPFLHDEFARVAKRKAETNPRSEGSPTKLGRFVLAEGHPLESNPNYAQFQRLLASPDKEQFAEAARELVHAYLRTPQVRGGVLLIVRARLEKYDDRFLFILKCDFETKTAVVTDERSLIANVHTAINAKNMKSLLYPHLIEPGLIDPYQVKIHQFSHARYFEEFLKHIEYPETMNELVSQEVLALARQHLEWAYPEPCEERQREEEEIERIAASPKRELVEKWEHEAVMEAAQIIVERQPELPLAFKLDHMQIRALLADYGIRVHIASVNGRYLVLLEGETLQFEKGVSPVEFLRPRQLREIVRELEQRPDQPKWRESGAADEKDDASGDAPPW